jgi:hypothetical protein
MTTTPKPKPARRREPAITPGRKPVRIPLHKLPITKKPAKKKEKQTP